jgi:hypothetical protein
MTLPALKELPEPDVRERRLSRSPGVWAGLIVAFAGLCLIALGGCFLVGVLEAVRMNTQAYLDWKRQTGSMGGTWIDQTSSLQTTLYTLAYVCFLLGAIALFFGIRGLVRIMRVQRATSE